MPRLAALFLTCLVRAGVGADHRAAVKPPPWAAEAKPTAKPAEGRGDRIDREYRRCARPRSDPLGQGLKRDDLTIYSTLRYNQEFGRVEADGGVRL